MTVPANRSGPAEGPRRGGRAQDRDITDPYRQTKKPHEPTVCPHCGAVYHKGRWQWAARPADAHEELCPACRRIKDDFPAGVVTIDGDFPKARRDEILALVRHQEDLEKAEHPVNRIMTTEDEADRITVAVTDLHLARRIGEALRSAFGGTLTLDYEEDGYFLRAAWRRDT